MADQAIDVSVIIAVKNGALTLKHCIESVLEQRGCAVEIILVDALSDDETQEIIESFGPQIHKYIRESDQGIYSAWNKALAVSVGEWCAFLGADDRLLHPDSLATLLATAREPGTEPVFVHGGILRTGGLEEYTVHPDPQDALDFMRSGQMIPHPGTLHRRAALQALGGFDESFRIAGDYAALLLLLRLGVARRCPAITTAMEIGGVSSRWETMGILAREKFRILRNERGFRFAISVYVGTRTLQVAGRIFERIVLLVLGSDRGARELLRVRKRFNRSPKLI